MGGGQWTLPWRVGRDCLDQMTAEVREERGHPRGPIKVLWVQKSRDDHYLDCEVMMDAAAVLLGSWKTAQVGPDFGRTSDLPRVRE